MTIRILAAGGAALATLAGCSGPAELDARARAGSAESSLGWAYRDLDQGREAKVILALEGAVTSDGENPEARFLTASAYIGEAGVNIYTFFDSFQDVLFSQSLADQVFSPKTHGSDLGFESAKEANDAPLQRVLVEVDHYLNLLRRVAVFLRRLPEVSEDRQPLLRQGLAILDEIQWEQKTDRRELALYRLLARLVYLRSQVMAVVGDSTVGEKSWFCDLGILKIKRKIEDFAEEVIHVGADAQVAFPSQGEAGGRLETIALELRERSRTLWGDLPSGVALGGFYFEMTAKRWLACGDDSPLEVAE